MNDNMHALGQPVSYNVPYRIVFGSTSIINNYYWSEALKKNNYNSRTIMFDSPTFITKTIKWDIRIKRRKSNNKHLRFFFNFLLGVKVIFLFPFYVLKADLLVISFDGFLIGKIPLLWRTQSFFIKKFKKKILVIPYGSDSYVYKKVASSEIQNGLIDSYPMSDRDQKQIEKRVLYWLRRADLIIPGFMHIDIFTGKEAKYSTKDPFRLPSPLVIDVDSWSAKRSPISAGDCLEIAHMPNHRGYKGTSVITKVVEELQKEGYKIKFHLIEGVPNEQVKNLLCNRIHILIDQIYAIGYGLNAIEGMSSSCVVLSNLSNKEYIEMYENTYLAECPIVSVNKFTLKQELEKILSNPTTINDLSKKSRAYVEKYHSYDFFSKIFKDILDQLYQVRV